MLIDIHLNLYTYSQIFNYRYTSRCVIRYTKLYMYILLYNYRSIFPNYKCRLIYKNGNITNL